MEKNIQKKSFEIKIGGFEGPLDLLLNLIAREEVEIYDIPIVKITDQYLEVVRQLPEMDLDLTTEFLVVAATLLEIKSKMLLPHSEGDMEAIAFDGHDPREELIKRLIAYKKFKEAANELKLREGHLDEVVFKEQEEISDYAKSISIEELNQGLEVDLLTEAVKRLLIKIERFDEQRKIYFKGIKRDHFTVEEKINFIQTALAHHHEVAFSALFTEKKTKEEVVVTFLALLELLKLKQIVIMQNALFDEIQIKKKTESECEETNEFD